MRSLKTMSVKLLSLAALLVGALPLVACGGGGLPGGTTLLLDGPVLGPPPAGPTLPDPIPMPDGDGTPIEPVLPEQPPADPPVVEDPPHEDPPPPVSAPDFARVSAMAAVTENSALAEPAEEYVGLYVADEDGALWRLLASGEWKQVGQVGIGLRVEAMTYVPAKHAFYLAIATNQGSRLLRWLLTPTPEVWDTSMEPPVLLDAGGEQLQELEDSEGRPFVRLERPNGDVIPVNANVTGLAYDTANARLYAWDHDLRGLFVVLDLDVADATLRAAFTLSEGRLEDVQDMAFDRVRERMLLVDAAKAEVFELDHLGLAFESIVGLGFADVRALAWEQDETRRAVDRASAALFRFDAAGTVLE